MFLSTTEESPPRASIWIEGMPFGSIPHHKSRDVYRYAKEPSAWSEAGSQGRWWWSTAGASDVKQCSSLLGSNNFFSPISLQWAHISPEFLQNAAISAEFRHGSNPLTCLALPCLASENAVFQGLQRFRQHPAISANFHEGCDRASDSKSGKPLAGPVGSNPTHSAN